MHTVRNRLTKPERLSSERRIEALFGGGRRGGAGPLRFCWIALDGKAKDEARDDAAATPEDGARGGARGGAAPEDRARDDLSFMPEDGTRGDAVVVREDGAAVSVLFSVPKKVFKRAWKRNLVKRRMRESYRLRKHELTRVAMSLGRHVEIALVCMPERGDKTKAGDAPASKAASGGTASAKIASGAIASNKIASGGTASAKAARTTSSKRGGAAKRVESPIPDFKSIDDAIEKILGRIASSLRR